MIIFLLLYNFLFVDANDKKISGRLFAGYIFKQFACLITYLATFCLMG